MYNHHHQHHINTISSSPPSSSPPSTSSTPLSPYHHHHHHHPMNIPAYPEDSILLVLATYLESYSGVLRPQRTVIAPIT
jgi:hypothetical protein